MSAAPPVKQDRFARTKHRLALSGYANILRLLERTPSTAPEVAAITKTTPSAIREVLRRMESLGLIHAIAWVPSKKGPHRAMYSFRRGSPQPYPGIRRACKSTGWNYRPELVAFANTIRALIEGPMTEQDLHELSGQSRTTLRYLMRHCKSIGLVHIAEWHKDDGRTPSPMWAIGNKADAPRPKPRPLIDLWREARQRESAKAEMLRFMPSLVRQHRQDQRATAEA